MVDNLDRSVRDRPQSCMKSSMCFGLTAASLALAALILQWAFQAVPGFLS